MELPGLSLVEDEQQQLVLRFAPADKATRSTVDVPGLRELAGAKGYAELAFDERSLGAAVIKIRRSEQCALVIARRTDAEYQIEIAPDEMIAWLTVVAACGGTPANALDAVAALGARNVREGVDATAVEAAVERCGVRLQVAKGTPPQPGKDAVLEPLVELNRQRHPQIDESGNADLHDLGDIPSVTAGEVLMRRHPPQPGVAGCNVFAQVVPAPVSKDIVFAARLQGAVPSPNDPDLLLAEISGQPLLHRDGVSVEPIVRYDDIDLSVGNVQFPGSIEVRGDIRSGMKVRAEGDVVVKGVIESADVSAGGDVKVDGGIIGHSLTPRETQHNATARTARISAGGNISARFIENAVVEAQHTVHVAESIVQSDITGLDQVIAGGKGKKGRILGGRVRATLLVAADFLGGEGSAPTRITVGINPKLQQEIDGNKQRLEAKLKEHDDLSKVVKLLQGRADKQALYDKARLTLQKVCADIGEEMERQAQLEAAAKLTDNAKIVAGERLCSGVTVSLGQHTRYVNEDLGRGVFHLDEGGELGFGTLARGQ
ncbi:MAG: DUF342 domain-containing protein [Betaproteobacteria bacterium]|nr:DUF342 domain-containing protein [Betaproteobacteria bacterium]